MSAADAGGKSGYQLIQLDCSLDEHCKGEDDEEDYGQNQDELSKRLMEMEMEIQQEFILLNLP